MESPALTDALEGFAAVGALQPDVPVSAARTPGTVAMITPRTIAETQGIRNIAGPFRLGKRAEYLSTLQCIAASPQSSIIATFLWQRHRFNCTCQFPTSENPHHLPGRNGRSVGTPTRPAPSPLYSQPAPSSPDRPVPGGIYKGAFETNDGRGGAAEVPELPGKIFTPYSSSIFRHYTEGVMGGGALGA